MSDQFNQWAIVDLLGHRRIAGRVTEEDRFGCAMGRCDVPQADGSYVTVYFGGSSVYQLTPVDEAVARAVALRTRTAPVQPWELPKLLPTPAEIEPDEDDEDDDDMPY